MLNLVSQVTYSVRTLFGFIYLSFIRSTSLKQIEIMIFSNPIFHFRRNTELTAESIKHLEKVFRENLTKDKAEFTLSEFKRIVPSKNVSIKKMTTTKYW